MTRFMLDDELLDAQALRVAGSAVYGGADVAECRAACAKVVGTDLTTWFDAWTAAADAALAIGEREEAAGHVEPARNAFLRASNYERNAGVMLLGAPIDPRLVTSQARQTAAFRRFAPLLERPPEVIEIPYGATSLPGYFFRAGDGRRATVILTGGYDGTAEELYLFNGAAALTRGYNVLAFDGPGQGAALIERGLTMRADWEAVITPVVDYAIARDDVDPARIALIGLSLGAHLAPRAASVEHRLAACIADCGSFDLFAAGLQRMPGPLARAFAGRGRLATAVLRLILARLVKQPTAGWALRRGILVHGAADVIGYLEMLRPFTLAGRAEAIRCPTWVCNAAGDDISASAPQLVDALTCDKTYVQFTAAEGADDHCEVGARLLYHERSFGWLDARLDPLSPPLRGA
jgi:dienelactone hydrolase